MSNKENLKCRMFILVLDHHRIFILLNFPPHKFALVVQVLNQNITSI